jgi:hypothetical protein
VNRLHIVAWKYITGTKMALILFPNYAYSRDIKAGFNSYRAIRL